MKIAIKENGLEIAEDEGGRCSYQAATLEAIARSSGVTLSIELVGRPGKPGGDLAAISRADLGISITWCECRLLEQIGHGEIGKN
ncbi:MAG: hypothetical protein JKY70_14135 [Mucilaginibacter sp.]|nr:hypothetical protein [Mucilaginibacter sp.]